MCQHILLQVDARSNFDQFQRASSVFGVRHQLKYAALGDVQNPLAAPQAFGATERAVFNIRNKFSGVTFLSDGDLSV